MDTNVCFVFLLAIGLSVQKPVAFETEFEIQLENLRTLLDCTENCETVKETACKCVHFNHCMNSTVFNCISTGLRRLFAFSELEEILERLTVLPSLHTTPTDPDQWHTPVSPKHFLNYIEEQHQKINAQRG